jgi:hypothetical protein
MVERQMASVVARPKEKQIQVTIRFNTDGMVADKKKIVPRHIWDEGWVTLDTNESHALRGQKKKSFHSLMEIPTAVESVLMQAGIRLHHGRKTRKYIETE